jgi:hypothetical protein
MRVKFSVVMANKNDVEKTRPPLTLPQKRKPKSPAANDPINKKQKRQQQEKDRARAEEEEQDTLRGFWEAYLKNDQKTASSKLELVTNIHGRFSRIDLWDEEPVNLLEAMTMRTSARMSIQDSRPFLKMVVQAYEESGLLNASLGWKLIDIDRYINSGEDVMNRKEETHTLVGFACRLPGAFELEAIEILKQVHALSKKESVFSVTSSEWNYPLKTALEWHKERAFFDALVQQFPHDLVNKTKEEDVRKWIFETDHAPALEAYLLCQDAKRSLAYYNELVPWTFRDGWTKMWYPYKCLVRVEWAYLQRPAAERKRDEKDYERFLAEVKEDPKYISAKQEWMDEAHPQPTNTQEDPTPYTLPNDIPSRYQLSWAK